MMEHFSTDNIEPAPRETAAPEVAPTDTTSILQQLMPTSDGHHNRADLRMLKSAAMSEAQHRKKLKRQFVMPERVAEQLPELMMRIAETDTKIVINKEGEEVEISNSGDQVRAASVLATIAKMDQEIELAEDKNERLDTGKPTELIHELRVQFDE